MNEERLHVFLAPDAESGQGPAASEEEHLSPQPSPEDDVAEPQVGDEDEAQEDLDPKKLLSELRRARKEAAKYRTRLRELERLEEERRRAEMTELERLKEDLERAQAETAALREELTVLRIRSAITSVAGKLGFADPNDAWRLIDMADIEFDEDGNPTNIMELLKTLAAQKPYLLRSRPVQMGPAGEGKPSPEKLREELFGGRGGSIWDGGGVFITSKGGE